MIDDAAQLTGLDTTTTPVSKNMVDKNCQSTIYYTPEKIKCALRDFYKGPIPFDAATDQVNPTGAVSFLTEAEDGRTAPWAHRTFVNPPYGKDMRSWTGKIRAESERGTEIVALLPCGARFSTRYWQNDILMNPSLVAVCYVRGRVKFLRPDGTVAKMNPYDSQILGFNVRAWDFAGAFRPLGAVNLVTPMTCS